MTSILFCNLPEKNASFKEFLAENRLDSNRQKEVLETDLQEHHVELGAIYKHAYLEPGINPSFSGNMGGIGVRYTYRPLNAFFGGLGVDWAYGTADSSNGSRDLEQFQAVEHVGYTFSLGSQDYFLTLFSGIGYRQNFQKTAIVGERTLDLRYNHLYLPLGFQFESHLTEALSIGCQAAWHFQLASGVTISPLNGAYWKLEREYKNVAIEFPCTFELQSILSGLKLSIVPQLDLWEDGKTTAQTSSGVPLGLPRNRYVFWGGMLSVAYAF